jgi:hypothetical protein
MKILVLYLAGSRNFANVILLYLHNIAFKDIATFLNKMPFACERLFAKKTFSMRIKQAYFFALYRKRLLGT